MHAGFQKSVWENGAGDDWFTRNKAELGNRDLILPTLDRIEGFRPKSVLEIGAANGWRLKLIKDRYDCKVTGIDPSPAAAKDATKNDIHIDVGTADSLPYPDKSFDLIIFGFCLCLIGPEDWLRVVLESDRVLKDGGMILTYDLVADKFYKRRMVGITDDKHLEERPLYLYTYNWPKLWLAYPFYTEALYLFDNHKHEICTALYKNLNSLLLD